MAKLFISIAICQAAGILGSFFTRTSVSTWYRTLVKPPFAPPNWLFAPVWTTIFVMMGISLYLIIKPDNAMAVNKKALTVFAFQLIFNILWSAAFFGLRSPLAGLAVIFALWLLIIFNIVEFYKISRAAGILLIPYLLWVSFALVLNFEYWRLN